ncbi:hypothetical protein MAR_026584, partial [Mya arenaria]
MVIVSLKRDGLTCYMCPPTRGETAEEANIECLALGQEMSCAQDQDRCYSRFESSRGMVEKGCSRSTLCIGTTSCCERSFCNA